MQMFFYNNVISSFEKRGEFRKLINYLEQEVPFSEKNFSTQIAYSWYLYSEGNFISPQVSQDWEFYKNKWEEKIELALNQYQRYPEICFIVAYTLEISGMDISDSLDYESGIQKLYKLSKNNIVDSKFSKLLEFICSNRKIMLENNILTDLFPNDSTIDKYFMEVLS